MTEPPIFVGGMYKSGTSLLRAMLGQHSRIFAGLETFWFDLGRGSDSPATLLAACNRLAHYFGLPAADVCAFHQEAVSPERFLDRLMRAVVTREGKPRWLEKTPGNIAHVDRIWAAWPNAQVLHIIRDPRDIFASLVEAKKWSGVDEFAERWCSTIGEGERLIAAIGPDQKLYLTLRYEDLICGPEVTMRKVLDYLGEPWESQVAAFEGIEEDFQKVLEATGKESTTLKRLKEPLTAQRVGIWKQVLSKRQVDDIRGAIIRRGFLDVYERVTALT